MMLTIKQQSTTYGYKSVHDLPTPPSTSRPSPPLNHQDPSFKPYLVSQNSPVQPMSTSHRGLPPPAAMTLPPQQPSSVGPPPPPPPPHHSQPPPPPPLAPSSHQVQQPWPSLSAGLPPPPQQWQGAEESMKTWLQAKTEEEKTRQEEEKTRQETLRLEQRRIEMDILRASLNGGIPPPIVPLVFAGMGSGGTLPQAALEWAQQFMTPAQSHHPQLLPPQRPHSPDHPREPMVPGHGVVFANEAKRADRLWCHWTTDGSSIKHDRHGKSTSTPRTRTAARDATLSRSSRAFAHAVAVISARYEPINLLSPLAAAGNAEREQLEPAGITLWGGSEKAKNDWRGVPAGTKSSKRRPIPITSTLCASQLFQSRIAQPKVAQTPTKRRIMVSTVKSDV
ncbi:hypothetical protein ACHAPX_003487 [Trichoderma viride]